MTTQEKVTAWIRYGGAKRWQKIAEADTEADVEQLLAEAIDRLKIRNYDQTVCKGEENPNIRKDRR